MDAVFPSFSARVVRTAAQPPDPTTQHDAFRDLCLPPAFVAALPRPTRRSYKPLFQALPPTLCAWTHSPSSWCQLAPDLGFHLPGYLPAKLPQHPSLPRWFTVRATWFWLFRWDTCTRCWPCAGVCAFCRTFVGRRTCDLPRPHLLTTCYLLRVPLRSSCATLPAAPGSPPPVFAGLYGKHCDFTPPSPNGLFFTCGQRGFQTGLVTRLPTTPLTWTVLGYATTRTGTDTRTLPHYLLVLTLPRLAGATTTPPQAPHHCPHLRRWRATSSYPNHYLYPAHRHNLPPPTLAHPYTTAYQPLAA